MMMMTRLIGLTFVIAAAAAAAAAAGPAEDQTVHLTLVSAGAQQFMCGNASVPLRLSAVRPAGLKRLPQGLSAHPFYGAIRLPAVPATEYAVVFDAPDGKPARLFVDGNGNGDLTDDPEADWTPKDKLTAADQMPFIPAECVGGKGGATVNLGTAAKPREVRLGVWLYQSGPAAAAAAPSLCYFRDYCTVGKVTLDGKAFDARLLDESASGSFAPAAGRTIELFVDLNGNGKADAGEVFEVGKPFKVRGSVYDVADVAPDGSGFRLTRSGQVAYEPSDVAVGKVAPPFDAVDSTGAAVAFPAGRPGRLVLLDFWATWCGPCMAEVPTVVAAYDKYHAKGFDIVGVSLDEADAGATVKRVTAQHHMAWPQLTGDAGKSRAVAQMYSVTGIPAAFLIDGDTGRILAAGEDLRGDKLAKVLAAKLDRPRD